MDLTTRYMGLALRNPLIASASPLNADVGNLRRLEDAGAAAVVLPSIFEEQIVAERREIELRTEIDGRRASPRRRPISRRTTTYSFGPERYLDIVRRAKDAIGIPVIASLNCVSRARLGRLCARAGAGRRRRDRAQHLFHSRRSRDDRSRRRAALSRYPGGGEGIGVDARRGQDRPVFQRDRRHGARACRCRRGRRWCCSTASTSRTSTSRRCA